VRNALDFLKGSEMKMTKKRNQLAGQKLWIWSYVFVAMVLSFQNCGPSFSSNSSSVALDSIQAATVITASNSNDYQPSQNLSFSYNQALIGGGPLVWSNLLNSTTSCTEVSANNANPYVVNCPGKGILSITLVVNSGTSGVVGPYTANFIVNDGLPRSTSLVPFVITATTGNWNNIGLTPPTFVPLFLQAGNKQYVIQESQSATVPGSFQFSFNNNNRFLNEVVPTWALTGDCTGAVASGNANLFNVTCATPAPPAPTTGAVNVTLTLSGSDPSGGPFSIPQATWTGTFTYASNSMAVTFAGLPPMAAAPTPDPTTANYIGPQELLQTNVVFVGQTLRFFNKASATKQFGLNFNGTPCASTGPIPYTTANDYSQYYDCVITSEFGDPTVGSPIANVYDNTQNFFLIAIDGTKLYNNNCQLCHLDLATARNQIGNETLARVQQAIMGQANSQPMLLFDNSYSSHLSNLSNAQKLAIVYALQN